jgi:hypothetical protein
MRTVRWAKLPGTVKGQSPRPAPPTRPDPILLALDRHGVEFVVIGGLAAQVHGAERALENFDLIPAPGRENMGRLLDALAQVRARPLEGDRELPEPAALGRDNHAFATRAGEVRVWNAPRGTRGYEAVRGRAVSVTHRGRSVAIASKDDVIAMKRSGGRSRDIADIAAMTRPERARAAALGWPRTRDGERGIGR